MNARHACDLLLDLGHLRRDAGVQLLQPAAAAHVDGARRCSRDDAASVQFLVGLDRTGLDSGLDGGFHDRSCERMVRRLLAVGRRLQQVGAAAGLDRCEPADFEAAGGQRARLVHDHGIDVRCGLEGPGLLDHDAQAGGGRERRHHRSGMRDQESAGAGDDQDGDRADRRLILDRLVGAAGREEPDQCGDHEDDPEVVRRELFDELLPLGLG